MSKNQTNCSSCIPTRKLEWFLSGLLRDTFSNFTPFLLVVLTKRHTLYMKDTCNIAHIYAWLYCSCSFSTLRSAAPLQSSYVFYFTNNEERSELVNRSEIYVRGICIRDFRAISITQRRLDLKIEQNLKAINKTRWVSPPNANNFDEDHH